MANTTWSTTDKNNITLSGGNLVATAAAGGSTWVRAADKQIAGKFYWEITLTTTTVAATATGIASPAIVLTNAGDAGRCALNRSGNLQVDGSNVITGFPAITSGTLICIAFDVDTRQIWFRVGAAGNWNNNATYNPATAVGGVNTGLGVGIPALPMFYAGTTSDAATANFGDTAFTGTVPSGFTSGFTAGVTSSTNALATQGAAEHWLTTNPGAQVTQVALEQWASVEAFYSPPAAPAMMLSGSRAGIGSAVFVQDNATRTVMIAGVGAVSQTEVVVPVGAGTAALVMIMA